VTAGLTSPRWRRRKSHAKQTSAVVPHPLTMADKSPHPPLAMSAEDAKRAKVKTEEGIAAKKRKERKNEPRLVGRGPRKATGCKQGDRLDRRYQVNCANGRAEP
jgi:hypothetical protein